MKLFLVFVGRILMSVLFLSGAYWHITNWQTALSKTAATGVMAPAAVLLASTILLLLGGICLLLGYKTNVGVVLLLIEMVPAAFLFHPFWTMSGNEMYLTFFAFQTKMAICGGLLCLYNTGPGMLSLKS